MNIIIYEDNFAKNLEPISLTRPVFSIRYGEGTLLDRIMSLCPEGHFGVWVRDEMIELTRELYPNMMVNELPKEETVWLNARVLWNKGMIDEIYNGPSMSFFHGDECIGAHLSGSVSEDWLHAGGPLSVFPPDEEIRHIQGGKTIHYLWDFLAHIPDAIQEIEKKEDERTWQQVEIDTANGPVHIGKNVHIEPFTFLKGPLYVGDNCFIASHSYINKSIIGPNCKLGGEINGTIIQGHSNKVHDGHLGDSFLGEWVNLGAGTTNSNLKNNYESVTMMVNGDLVNSNTLFLGTVIGDHSKTAIGTQLNTGTNIGVGCNVLAQTFPKRHIPSFTFCVQGKHRLINFDDMINTAKSVKQRRNMEITPAETALLKSIYFSR